MPKHHKIDLLEAANITWHIRVNGLDERVTPEHLKQIATTLDRLVERDRLIDKLLNAVDKLNTVESVELKELVEGRGYSRN